jgi:hypothetical protein
MSGEIQKPTIYNKHMKAKAEGQTCIDRGSFADASR